MSMEEFVRIVESLLPRERIRVTEVWGGAPYQAYGWLNDERFYFKYRYGTAQLRVGLVDEAEENAINQKHLDFALSNYEKIEREILEGLGDARDLFTYKSILEKAHKNLIFDINGPRIIPQLISQEGRIDYGDEYDMMLDHVTAANLFADCFHVLEEPLAERKNMYEVYKSLSV